MKRPIRLVILLALVVPCRALGQAQTTQPPKPGPEVQQMAQWLGTWQCEYENKTGAQAKGEASMGCEWAAGGFFMVCKSGTWTSVAGYDSEEKAYGEFRYFNDGWMDFSKGWTSGNTWTFVYEGEHSGGKARRRQVVSTFQSPTVWTYQWDRSVEGGPWVTTTVGKCSKVK